MNILAKIESDISTEDKRFIECLQMPEVSETNIRWSFSTVFTLYDMRHNVPNIYVRRLSVDVLQKSNLSNMTLKSNQGPLSYGTGEFEVDYIRPKIDGYCALVIVRVVGTEKFFYLYFYDASVSAWRVMWCPVDPGEICEVINRNVYTYKPLSGKIWIAGGLGYCFRYVPRLESIKSDFFILHKTTNAPIDGLIIGVASKEYKLKFYRTVELEVKDGKAFTSDGKEYGVNCDVPSESGIYEYNVTLGNFKPRPDKERADSSAKIAAIMASPLYQDYLCYLTRFWNREQKVVGDVILPEYKLYPPSSGLPGCEAFDIGVEIQRSNGNVAQALEKIWSDHGFLYGDAYFKVSCSKHINTRAKIDKRAVTMLCDHGWQYADGDDSVPELYCITYYRRGEDHISQWLCVLGMFAATGRTKKIARKNVMAFALGVPIFIPELVEREGILVSEFPLGSVVVRDGLIIKVCLANSPIRTSVSCPCDSTCAKCDIQRAVNYERSIECGPYIIYFNPEHQRFHYRDTITGRERSYTGPGYMHKLKSILSQFHESNLLQDMYDLDFTDILRDGDVDLRPKSNDIMQVGEREKLPDSITVLGTPWSNT